MGPTQNDSERPEKTLMHYVWWAPELDLPCLVGCHAVYFKAKKNGRLKRPHSYKLERTAYCPMPEQSSRHSATCI